jgi:hypothetical protein
MMVGEQTILVAERLRDELNDLKSLLRSRFSASSQVTSVNVRQQVAILAEKWLVELGADNAVNLALGDPVFADLNVHFQRLLTFSEHATKRSRYYLELRSILNNYSTSVILPLKQMRGKDAADRSTKVGSAFNGTVFVGQSFEPLDAIVNKCVHETLEGLGLAVFTGDRPKADRISEKVKSLIEGQSIFVGIFTRRDKIARKTEWTTSQWVLDEKAYAVGRQKPLILLREEGVNSIGGIQGDYEYIEFSRDALELLVVKIVHLFQLTNHGLRQ